MPTMIFLYDASVLEWFINPVKNLMSKGLLTNKKFDVLGSF